MKQLTTGLYEASPRHLVVDIPELLAELKIDWTPDNEARMARSVLALLVEYYDLKPLKRDYDRGREDS